MSAFKWHRIRDADVAEFGTSLPGAAVGLEERAAMMRCVAAFGWPGPPGARMSFARAAECDHERRRPPGPRVNDAARYSSRWLTDDGIIIEPKVGLRPWQSAEERDNSTRRAQGRDPGKLGERGTFQAEHLARGLHLDVAEQRIR